MSEPPYRAARVVAAAVEAHFAGCRAEARDRGAGPLAPAPDAEAIAAIIDAGFWASLRREEGVSPRISLAYVPPDAAGDPLTFERSLPLDPDVLTKLAPAVERPGIHLGVWRDDGRLRVWGTTRAIPHTCFVLEVVEPGLLVVKRRRERETGKFANVVVLQGDRVRLIDESGTDPSDCASVLLPLIGLDGPGGWADPVNIVVQLAVSMRAHGRGGSLLLVPEGSERWHESIVRPISYRVAPPFQELASLARLDPDDSSRPLWLESLQRAVAAVAGLTAVDGATVISDHYRVLAFGAKIGRPPASEPVQRVLLVEPVANVAPEVLSPLQLGGTRHLSAAQFVHDQRDAVALVASQDGRFTAFAWSPCEEMVRAHRVEVLLM